MVCPLCAGCRKHLTAADVLVCAVCWSLAVGACLSKARYESSARARGRLTHSKAARRLTAANPQAVLKEIACPLCQGVHHATAPSQRPSKTRHLHRTLAALHLVYPQLHQRYQQAHATQALQDLARHRLADATEPPEERR